MDQGGGGGREGGEGRKGSLTEGAAEGRTDQDCRHPEKERGDSQREGTEVSTSL